MTPAAKTFLSIVGVVGVSAAVVLAVLTWGGSGGRTNGTRGGAGVPEIIVDNGAAGNDDPLRPDYRVEQLSIPAFSQTDQDGRTVTNDVLKGRVTIVSFFFTRCTFICPALTGAMLEMMDRLKDTQARFVSFSVDPEHDTPAVMKEYAANHSADLSRWTFLSGKKEETWGLLRQGLKWGIEERPEERIQLQNGSSIANIRHPGWFALVGPDAKVLGIFQASEDEQLTALETRVRACLRKLK